MSLKSLLLGRFAKVDSQRKQWLREASKKSRKFGTYLYSENVYWKKDLEFLAAVDRTRDIRGIPDPRCFFLQSAIRSVANITGDVAECGVREGRSTLFMLLADPASRDYFLFDSWEGLSEPTAADAVAENGVRQWKAGDIPSDEKTVRQTLSDFKNVHFMRGWIPQRFDEVADRKFAFAHIDVDLFEPTRDALDFFGPRISMGGLIVCDDYGFTTCPGARKACDDFVARHQAKLIEVPTGQALIFDIPRLAA